MRGRIRRELVDAAGRLLAHGAEEVAVAIQACRNRIVTEHRLNEFWVSAGFDGDGGGRVSEIVYPGVDPAVVAQALAALRRSCVWRGEDLPALQNQCAARPFPPPEVQGRALELV